MDGDEKDKAKRLAAPYHEEAQRKAQDMVRALLAEIKGEPLPNERALTREDHEMKDLERRLAKLLTPFEKLETTVVKNQKSKNSKKKRK